MAKVAPEEQELRRVIDEEREVEGLGPDELLAIYRSLDPAPHVRRALGRLPLAGPDRDVRDLLEPRGDAGRLGARARRRGLDLPELPRVGDRAAPRHAAEHRPALVARPPRRLVEPGGVPGRVYLRADRDARLARGRPRLGREAEGQLHRRDRLLRRRRHERRLLPRGRQPRGGDAGAADPLLQQQPVGDLDAARGPDARRRRSPTRPSATACPACASTAATCSRCTR